VDGSPRVRAWSPGDWCLFGRTLVPQVVLDVVSVGDICVDFVTTPLKGFHPGDRQLWLPALPMIPGGNATNFALGTAALGLRTGLVACIGGDVMGEHLRRTLRKTRVEPFLATRRDLETGRTFALTHADGTRQLITYNGSNLALRPADVPRWTLHARHVHRSGYWWTPQLQGRPTKRILRSARDGGAETSLDVSTDPEGWPKRRRDKVLAVLPEVSILFVNEQEMAGVFRTRSFDRAAREALSEGVEILAVHRGARGCRVAASGVRVDVPAFRVAPRNPTGAGDLFNAGFVYGRLRGWDLPRCARFANAVAAARVAGPPLYPTKAEVLRRLRRGKR